MMDLIILIISSILIYGGVTSTAEKLRFLSGETDYDDPEASAQRAWSAFKTQYGKSYPNSEEDQRRRLIFEESSKIVQSHNQLYETGRSSYKMGINKFSDMESSEIRKMTGYVGRKATYSENEKEFPQLSVNDFPDSVDWRKQGYVTEVKDQEECGSCWAFSATGSLEGQMKNKTGKLVSLSEQNLVDCSWPEGNTGCAGGDMSEAFDYIKINGGIDTEESYTYKGEDEPCRYKPAGRGATVRGYVNIKSGSEKALTMAIANIGPISVAINFTGSFYQYTSGIYEDSACSNAIEDLDHAVLAVGYGGTKGKEYYIVKNSWGAAWGDNGYVLMARNKKNMCGIATAAIYPLV